MILQRDVAAREQPSRQHQRVPAHGRVLFGRVEHEPAARPALRPDPNRAARTLPPAASAQPARLPLSIGDPTLVSGATSVTSMSDLFMYYLQGGLVDAALLGGAQIDRYGNLNTTVIGNYDQPKVRLPGSGGACEIAINAKKTFMIMRLKRRAFVEQLNFQTSPGHLGNGRSRGDLDLPGAGPQLVITDRALFDFDNQDHQMTLIEVARGETAESIQQEVGWPLRISPNLREIKPPTSDELRIIREHLDPNGLYR